MPWWVKFLWACSRQCKKNNNNNLHMDRQCKKNNKKCTYGQTVQKKLHWSIYSAPDSAKKTTTIYIWTVHIYRRQCAKYTYIYSVYISVYISRSLSTWRLRSLLQGTRVTYITETFCRHSHKDQLLVRWRLHFTTRFTKIIVGLRKVSTLLQLLMNIHFYLNYYSVGFLSMYD